MSGWGGIWSRRVVVASKKGLKVAKILVIPYGMMEYWNNEIVFCFYVSMHPTTISAWLIILLTGNYPKGMFDFVVGVMH